MQEQLQFKKALALIFFSTLIFSGSAYFFLKMYYSYQENRLSDDKYNIVKIIQTTPDKERLNSFYLAELLRLSLDKPTNLYGLSIDMSLKRLLSSPIIANAKVQKIEPSTLFIDYSLRKPVAYLTDYTNTLIDHEAIAFPFKPFFTPKNLPEIYLGINDESFRWGKKIDSAHAKLGLYLIEYITKYCCNEEYTLKRLDVSNVLSDSHGQRQIIVYFEKKNIVQNKTKINQEILRLSVNNYRQDLANYLTLRKWLEKNSINIDNNSIKSQLVIDLRIPELAFIRPLAKLGVPGK